MSLFIEFKSKNYWLISDSLDASGALAPLHHCDDEGWPICLEDSYAHYFTRDGGVVMRYRRQIGTRADIKVLPPPNVIEGEFTCLTKSLTTLPTNKSGRSLKAAVSLTTTSLAVATSVAPSRKRITK